MFRKVVGSNPGTIHILDGHYFTYICCKNCNDVCLKRPNINEKEAGVGPFFKKNKGKWAVSTSSLFIIRRLGMCKSLIERTK